MSYYVLLPAWEGGQDGRHAGFQPALLKEERDAPYNIVIYSSHPENGCSEGAFGTVTSSSA